MPIPLNPFGCPWQQRRRDAMAKADGLAEEARQRLLAKEAAAEAARAHADAKRCEAEAARRAAEAERERERAEIKRRAEADAAAKSAYYQVLRFRQDTAQHGSHLTGAADVPGIFCPSPCHGCGVPQHGNWACVTYQTWWVQGKAEAALAALQQRRRLEDAEQGARAAEAIARMQVAQHRASLKVRPDTPGHFKLPCNETSSGTNYT